MKRRTFEEIIILVIVIVNMLEFTSIKTFSSGDVKFMVKSLSWLAVGYLFYSISIMRILFGKDPEMHVAKGSLLKNHHLDLLILICFYMLMFGDFTFFIASTKDLLIFKGVSDLLITNSQGTLIEFMLFPLGGLLLGVISSYIGAKISFQEKSFMGLIGEIGEVKTAFKHFYRALISFILLSTFFITFFSLVSEWFSLALHELYSILGAFVLIYILRNKKLHNFREIHVARQILDFFDNLDERIVESFHMKSKIWLVFKGIILLHVFTDFLSLVLPTFFGLETPYNRQDALSIFGALKNAPQGNVALPIGYTLNFAAISLLAVGSFYLWYKLFSNKKPGISRKLVGVYAFSVFILFAKPLFIMQPYSTGRVIGVSTIFLLDESYSQNFLIIAFIALVLGIIAWYFSERLGNLIVKLPFLMFISLYLFLFLLSIIRFYTAASLLNCSSGYCLYHEVFRVLNTYQIYSPFSVYIIDVIQLLSLLLESIFFIITLCFYMIGYVVILNLLHREKIEIA